MYETKIIISSHKSVPLLGFLWVSEWYNPPTQLPTQNLAIRIDPSLKDLHFPNPESGFGFPNPKGHRVLFISSLKYLSNVSSPCHPTYPIITLS